MSILKKDKRRKEIIMLVTTTKPEVMQVINNVAYVQITARATSDDGQVVIGEESFSHSINITSPGYYEEAVNELMKQVKNDFTPRMETKTDVMNLFRNLDKDINEALNVKIG